MQSEHSGDYYRQLFDDAPIMYVITSKAEAPIVREINQQFLTRLGYSREEVVGQELWRFYSADSAAKFAGGGYQRALDASFRLEERELLSADGETVPTILKALPLYDEWGNPIGTKAMFIDLSAQKQTERALRAERNFSDAILNTVGALIIVFDREGRIVRFNQACEEAFGYKANALIGDFVWNWLIPEQQIEKTKQAFNAFVAGDSPGSAESTWLASNGEPRYILWNPTRIFDDAGRLTHVINTGIDLTVHRAVEAALHESEDRFRQLAENIEAVFYITDAQSMRMLYISRPYERIWQRSRESLYDDLFSFVRAIHEDDQPRVYHAFARQREGKETTEVYRVIQPNGEIRWVQDRSFPVRNKQGEIHRVVGIAEDVTEHKIAEFSLQRRLEMESLVGQISKQFINARTREIDNIINVCLQHIGEFVDVDRCYIFQLDGTKTLMSNTYEWCALGITPEIDNLQDLPSSIFPWWMACLDRGEVVSIPRVSELPPEAENEREILSQQSIQSVLIVPLVYRGDLTGFLGFDSVCAEKQWETQDSILLQLVGEVIINALQRRDAEEVALRNQLRLSLALEGAADGLFDYDIDAREIYCSPRFYQLLGYQKHEDEISSSPDDLGQFIHSDDLGNALQAFRNAMKVGSTFSLDMRVRLRNGVYRWFNCRGGMRVEPFAEKGHLAGFITDISEQKAAQEQIRITAQRLAALNEISRHTVSAASPEELAKTALAQLQKLVPYNAASIIGRDPATGQLTVISLSTGSDCAMNDLGAQGTDCISRLFEHDLGKRVWYFPSLQEVEDPFPMLRNLQLLGTRSCCLAPLYIQEALIGVLCLRSSDTNAFSQEHLDVIGQVADLLTMGIQQRRLDQEIHAHAEQLEQRVEERTSALSRANAELERANRLKDDFLANMSHELRTPLNAILGKVELMQQGIHGSLTEKQARSLNVVHDSGLHLLSLINDILDLSKIEAGKLLLEANLCSVFSLCRASLAFVKESAQKKQIELALDVDNRLTVMCDERRLKQILVNLLSNAVKFTPEHGKVRLNVETDATHGIVHFRVWDTGIGIAQDQLEHLFQPFVQLDSSFTRQHSGTGLGLSLVRRLAELHGGSVSIESEVGKGSCFTVSLPWESPAETLSQPTVEPVLQSSAVSAAQPSSPKTNSILVVDDNEINLALLNEYLSHSGYRLTLARSGKECIDRFADEHFDLVLMDVQMPGMDGLEATRILRNTVRGANVPIIALTALAMPGDHQKCLDAGMNDYVTKPLPLRKLKQMIADYLAPQKIGD
ncbi:PAS domain S-box protein [bacterium]|nr:PAS domain S-box protein [bacterium]